MLKWKLQYFGHLMGRTDSLEKTLMLGKIEGRRRRGQQRGLAGYSPRGHKESDMTERLTHTNKRAGIWAQECKRGHSGSFHLF